MSLANRLFPWVVGVTGIAAAAIAIDHFVARHRAATLCDELAPGTDSRRVAHVVAQLKDRPGVMSSNDRSREAIARDPARYGGALSVGFSGPLSTKMHCTVWLEAGKVKQASVTNTYVPPTTTIGIRP